MKTLLKNGLSVLLFFFFFTKAESGLARDILFSDGVTPVQIRLLTGDLQLDLHLVDSDPSLRELLGLTNLNHEGLVAWITDRVGYIVGEKEPADVRALSDLETHYPYQNAGIFPDPNFEGRPPVDEFYEEQTADKVVMTNVGAFFYTSGKMFGTLKGYPIHVQGKEVILPVTSPRVGIVQIGEGLFDPRINGAAILNENLEAVSNTLDRFSSLLHESRHSDGSGKSLGFMHAVCPQNHPLYGKYACDNNSNGPYAIEARFLRQGLLTCVHDKTCSVAEAEVLSILATDYRSRVLNPGTWDPTPEGL